MQKLPNGHYKVTVSSGSGVDRKRQSRTFSSKKEANRWQQSMELLKSNSHVLEHSGTRLVDAYTAYIKKYKQRSTEAATYVGYINTLKMLKKNVPTLILRDITHDKMQALFNRLAAKGLDSRTLKKYKSNLGAAFRMFVQQGILDKNYLELVDCRTKIDKKQSTNVLSIAQYTTLVGHLKQQAVQQMTCWDIMALVMLTTGVRTQEVQGLTEDSVDFDKHTITISQAYCRVTHAMKAPKTKRSYRTIPIPSDVLRKLTEWHQRHVASSESNTPLILDSNGKVPDSASFNYHFRKLQQRVLSVATNDMISPHGCRRTFASVMLSKDFGNMSIEVISQILGDTINVVNDFYRKVMPETVNVETEKMLDKLQDIA